jgi:hypothetical protein
MRIAPSKIVCGVWKNWSACWTSRGGRVSEGVRLWWVEMAPYLTVLAVMLVGLLLALAAGFIVFRK